MDFFVLQLKLHLTEVAGTYAKVNNSHASLKSHDLQTDSDAVDGKWKLSKMYRCQWKERKALWRVKEFQLYFEKWTYSKMSHSTK